MGKGLNRLERVGDIARGGHQEATERSELVELIFSQAIWPFGPNLIWGLQFMSTLSEMLPVGRTSFRRQNLERRGETSDAHAVSKKRPHPGLFFPRRRTWHFQ